MDKWVKRIGAAALIVASVLGCTNGCTTTPGTRPPIPAATPAPPSTTVDVIGVWRVSVNGGPVDALMVFWPGGLVGTTDPGYGVWRSRPGGAEGTWETPVASLTITYIVLVTGDALIGTGLVYDQARPTFGPHPLRLVGSRVKIDQAALGSVALPRPS